MTKFYSFQETDPYQQRASQSFRNTEPYYAPSFSEQTWGEIGDGLMVGLTQSTPGQIAIGGVRRFGAPNFEYDPDFDPYDEAAKRGVITSIDQLKGASSKDEFDYILGNMRRDQIKAAQAAETPVWQFAGAMAGDLMLPSNMLALRVPKSFAQLKRQTLGTGAMIYAEENMRLAVAEQATVTEVLASVALGTVATGAIQGALLGANRIVDRFATGPENAADAAAKAEAEMNRARGSNQVAYDAETGEPFNPLDPDAKSVGAAQLKKTQSDAERIHANQMADALGLENLPPMVTPLTRVVHNKDVPEVSEVGLDLIEPPYALNRNMDAGGNDATPPHSVENELRVRWRPEHARWRQNLDAEYRGWLDENQASAPGGFTVVGDLQQRFKKSGLTYRNFRQQVWRDLVTGMQDAKVSPAVRRAATRTRKMYDDILNEVMDLDLHVHSLKKQLAKTQDPAKRASIEADIKGRTAGILKNRGKYMNVIFDKETIRKDYDGFVSFVMAKKRLDRKAATDLVEDVLQQKPFTHLDPEGTGTARSLHERTLVDDPLEWSQWIETDVLNLGTLYFRTMTPDIELMRKFGSVDMAEQIDQIRQKYKALQSKHSQGSEEWRKLVDKEKDAVSDILAIRDVIRGTYMIPPDPEHDASRAIRIAKNWNAATMLTGALAAVPDLARMVTANGLKRSMGSLYEGLRNPKLYKLAKYEARMVGEAWDMVLGTRAAVFADIGEAVGAFSRAERIAAEVGQQTFNVNLMNFWNETMKSASSLVVSTKILDAVEAAANGKASQKQRKSLAASGIDQDMVKRIYAQRDKWDVTDHNKIARTSTWDDKDAQRAFRGALSRELNIVILTPGLGERPLWTMKTLDKQLGVSDAPGWLSQPYLSLVAQFKSFMISSTYRTVVPGLQDRDGDVLAMIAIATGMGLMIEHIRAEQNGYAPPTDLADALISGFDRAGLAGWYLEPNNVIERLSGNELGLRPMLSNPPQYSPSARTVLGSIFGPTGAQVGSMLQIGEDVLNGEFDAYTMKRLRSVTWAYQNTAHLDPMFDLIERHAYDAQNNMVDGLERLFPNPSALSQPYQ